MKFLIMSASRPGCAVMPRETQMASPVAVWSPQSASPPSAATGEVDAMQPTDQAALQMFDRMCQTAS
jgi:hypothetical protein